MSWSLGNRLIYSSGLCKKKDPQITDVQWHTSLYNPMCRKLINVSNGIFLSLQKLAKDSEGDSLKPQAMKISLQYRSIIKDCIDDLNAAISDCNDDAEKEYFDLICQVFYKIELIWNLFEIVMFHNQPGNSLLHQLLGWIRWHFTTCDQIAISVIDSEVPEYHEDYWNAVYGFCFQGRFTEVIKMLELHSSFDSPSFQCVALLLKRAPLSFSSSASSSSELEYKWYHWRNECSQKYKSGEVSGNKHLEVLTKILIGDENTFVELMPLFDTWYQYMVSKLLFTDPNASLITLGEAALTALEKWEGDAASGTLDGILLALCEGYIVEAIQGCQVALDNSWFTAHLSDLLYHTNSIGENEMRDFAKLREFILLEYSALLMSHPSLWQVGVDYLDHCPMYGHGHLRTYLEHLPLSSDLKANKIIAIANERSMTDVATSICKVLSRQCLRHKKLGSALTWALRASDAGLTSHIADQYLHSYMMTGTFSNLDLLDRLGSSMLISNRLVFLGKYREFQLLHQEKKSSEAASLLIDLISSNLSPIYFSFNLLQDAIPLLQSSPPIFSSAQTFQLMASVESMVKKVEANLSGFPEKPETLKLLRAALASNLANSFIKESNK